MEPIPTRTANSLTRVLLLAALLAVGPLLLAARPAAAARTFTVNLATDQADLDLADDRCDISTNPGLQCTFRAAIQEANNTLGPDTIAFNIPGPPNQVKVIRPDSSLPALTQPVTIDGYTQPGARPNTTVTGTNAVLRIELDGSNAGSETSGLRIEGSNSLIRGLAIGRISEAAGIAIGDGATGVRVTGCFVGTNAGGTLARSNNFGIFVNGPNAMIGNAAPAARNLISGNGSDGVLLNSSATGARVLGNLIGTNRTGTAPLPNEGSGVETFTTDTRIGGNGAAEANVIQFNGGAGVAVRIGTRNRVLRNAIGANAGLGIDLNRDGRTPNDPNDADDGPNTRQNFPVITVATANLVRITLNSKPNRNFFVRVFSNPGSGDEGIRFHGGPFTVRTDGSGNTGPVNLTPDPPIPAGRSVTVTATSANGDTSEFSAPEPVA